MNILEVIFSMQTTLFASLEESMDPLTQKEREFVRILGLAQIERFTGHLASGRIGRPRHSRQAIARAFVAKALYNLPTTDLLVEFLKTSKNPRRLCGWEHATHVPSAATFSRAFREFVEGNLLVLVHETMVKTAWGNKLAGHVSRDATEIEAREKPAKQEAPVPTKKKKHRRGRPRKGEIREPKPARRMEIQGTRSLQENLEDLPTACDVGVKRSSKGHTHGWRGYKLHLDTLDGGIPVSAILTSASLHDSQVAIPLTQLTATRVQNCYDLMDSAYDSPEIHAFSRAQGHIPLISPNPRYHDRLPFSPAQAVRYDQRTVSERVHSELKDNHGGRFVRVRGALKVFTHLMFGIVVITANQLLRLLE